jgi:hypothetical protein
VVDIEALMRVLDGGYGITTPGEFGNEPRRHGRLS